MGGRSQGTSLPLEIRQAIGPNGPQAWGGLKSRLSGLKARFARLSYDPPGFYESWDSICRRIGGRVDAGGRRPPADPLPSAAGGCCILILVYNCAAVPAAAARPALVARTAPASLGLGLDLGSRPFGPGPPRHPFGVARTLAGRPRAGEDWIEEISLAWARLGGRALVGEAVDAGG